MYRTKLYEKLSEALRAVLPIVAIVLLLSLTVAPMPASILLVFLLGLFCTRRFSGRGLRLRRCYHRAYDGALYYGIRPRYLRHPKRQPRRG